MYEDILSVLKNAPDLKNLEFDLVIYGSVVNGLQDKQQSDIDMTIIVHKNALVEDHKSFLERVKKAIHNTKFEGIGITKGPQLFWMSAGALLKLSYELKSDLYGYKRGQKVKVDISVNKFAEIFNS